MSDSIKLLIRYPTQDNPSGYVEINEAAARMIVSLAYGATGFLTTGPAHPATGLFPACITNPHDLDPAGYARAASALGAKPVEIDKPTLDPTDAPHGYYAEARDVCFGCAFAVPGTLECNIGPSQTCCTPEARDDGCSVIFRKMDAKPSGDDAKVSATTHAYAVRYAEQMIGERDKALADLAAMTERAEKAEESQRLTQKAREDDRGMLQQKCSNWGCYWRAPDAHGVALSIEQAVEILQDALGVEVEIKDAARAEADALRASRDKLAGLLRRVVSPHENDPSDVRRCIDAALAEVVREGGSTDLGVRFLRINPTKDTI